MKRIITFFVGLALPVLTMGQQPVSKSFTIDECISYALENSNNIRNAILDERAATAKVKETVGIGLPQIDGSISLMHNRQLSRFFALYSTAQNFAGTDETTGQPNLNIAGVNPSDIVAMQNFFQLKSSGSASLSLNQILFNGSYLVGLQASSAFKELSVKTTNQTREQTIEAVTKAFYSALINRERMELFESNIARVDTLFRNTKALHENGFAESIDVDRIHVTLNNLVTERNKFEKLQQLSIELLKFQMNYPMDQNIDLTGDLSGEVVHINLDDYLKDWNYKNRPDYQVLEVNRKLQTLNLKNTNAAILPSLVAFGSLGYATQSSDIGGLFKTNTGLTDNGIIGPDKWYSLSSFGVSLNMPIFSGLQRHHRTQQEKLKLQKVENGFKTIQSSIDLQIKQSTIMYQNAIDALESQQSNMDLARNVARVTQIKYQQGVGSNIEVVNAESSLKEAQINYYNAMYDALVAKTDLDKAFGKLLPTIENK